MSILSLFLAPALAVEGMWLPEQLPDLADDLAAHGLEISASELADPLAGTLGATALLGWGCTASFASPDGLVLTNHHCVTGYLSFASAEAEADLAEDGFVAPDRAGELWTGPNGRMVIVERITDVTDEVRGALPRRGSDTARARALRRVRSELVAECEAEEGRRCQLASFHGGVEYRLLDGLEIRDVRLVYAPPESVGQFGGDIDNWAWPRHGADVGILRAYVGLDGRPADHAAENVPYHPPHYLEVAWDGVEDGDFVMVSGYPGATERYRLAAESRAAQQVALPARLRTLDALLAALEPYVDDPDAGPRVASSRDYLANGQKYYAGLQSGLARVDDLALREAREQALEAWIAEDRSRRRVGRALEELREGAAAQADALVSGYPVNRLLRTSKQLWAAHTAYRVALVADRPDADRPAGLQERDLPQLRAGLEHLDETLWAPAEADIVAAAAALPDAAPPLVAADPAELAAHPLGPREELLEWDVEQFEASEEPWIRLAVALEGWLGPRRAADFDRQGAELRLRPVVNEALLELAGPAYPDANSTLRVTYGTVQGAPAADGLCYEPFTTLQGFVAKAGDAPFDAPAELVEAARSGPESRWADPELGDVPVNFLSDLDTTGGNSGSPTLDGRGRLVGLLFDGTWESVQADWAYDQETTRSIHLDVRYLGWLLEQQAPHVLAELGGS